MQKNYSTLAATVGLPFLSAVLLSACGGSSSKSAETLFAQDVAPLLSLDTPVAGAYITTANFEAFTLSGSCGYNGGTVTVQTTNPVMGSAPCIANTWSVTLDVSFLFDGMLAFNVTHVGPLGEVTTPVSRSYLKDTLPPTGATLVIGDGVTMPVSPLVTLALTASGATKMYITNLSGCTAGGSLEPYATTRNWTIQPTGGTATVYAIFSDDAGNTSPCVSATINVNFTAPTVAITTPIPGTFINLANVGAFPLSGTCSEEGLPVVISGSAFASVLCTGHVWSSTLNLSAAADGSVTFIATHLNTVEMTSTASATYPKDTSAPTVAITLPSAASFINLSNQAAFLVSGTCSENGQSVSLSGAISSSTLCSAGVWSASLNLTSAPEGAVIVNADLMDLAGNPAVRSTRTFTKDAVAPTGTLVINAGAATTASTSVMLTLNSLGATEMYITNTPGCAAGGTFEPYATGKNWVLGQLTGAATVYVAFRDLAGNLGACISDQISVGTPSAPLAISPAAISLSAKAAQTATFTGSGGAGTYRFSIVSGAGAIDPITGLYTVAAGAQGTTLVRVTDANANTADALITHTDRLTFPDHCYNLQVIGMRHKSKDLKCSNRHTIFVPIDGSAKIRLTEGPSQVLEGNGTNGAATFSLPKPDPTDTENTKYAVYSRVVGQPGSHVDQRTCATDPLDPTSTYCSQTILTMDRDFGPSKFQDVTQNLLSVDSDHDRNGTTDRDPIFSPNHENYFWDVDADDRIHVQLKFCPISSHHSRDDDDNDNDNDDDDDDHDAHHSIHKESKDRRTNASRRHFSPGRDDSRD